MNFSLGLDDSLLADTNPNLLIEVNGAPKKQAKSNLNSASEQLPHMDEFYERKNDLNMFDRNDDDHHHHPHHPHQLTMGQTKSKFDDEDESGLPSDIIEFVDNNDDFLLECDQKGNNFVANFDDKYVSTNKNTNSLFANELLADPSTCLSTSVIMNSLGKNSKMQEFSMVENPSQTTSDLKTQNDIVQNIK